MQASTDSLLVPVLAEYEKRQSQLRLDAFYSVTHRFAKIKSKRLQAAVSSAMGRALPEEMVLSESLVAEVAAKASRKQKSNTSASTQDVGDMSPEQELHRPARGVATKRKRSYEAEPHDGLYDPDGEPDYVDKVIQGFFY